MATDSDQSWKIYLCNNRRYDIFWIRFFFNIFRHFIKTVTSIFLKLDAQWRQITPPQNHLRWFFCYQNLRNPLVPLDSVQTVHFVNKGRLTNGDAPIDRNKNIILLGKTADLIARWYEERCGFRITQITLSEIFGSWAVLFLFVWWLTCIFRYEANVGATNS